MEKLPTPVANAQLPNVQGLGVTHWHDNLPQCTLHCSLSRVNPSHPLHLNTHRSSLVEQSQHRRDATTDRWIDLQRQGRSITVAAIYWLLQKMQVTFFFPLFFLCAAQRSSVRLSISRCIALSNCELIIVTSLFSNFRLTAKLPPTLWWASIFFLPFLLFLRTNEREQNSTFSVKLSVSFLHFCFVHIPQWWVWVFEQHKSWIFFRPNCNCSTPNLVLYRYNDVRTWYRVIHIHLTLQPVYSHTCT